MVRGVWRRAVSAALVVLTVLLLGAAAVAGYARSELADKRAFSARAGSALEDDQFRAAIAEKTVDGLVQVVTPELLIIRPLLVPALSALAGTPPFRRVFERVVRARHRALTEGGSGFVFDLSRADGRILDAIRSVSPRAARAIGPDLQLRLAVLDARSFEVTGARVLADLARWWWPLVVASLLCATAVPFWLVACAGPWRSLEPRPPAPA